MTVCFFALDSFSIFLHLVALFLADRHIEKLGDGAEAQVLLMEHKIKRIKYAVKKSAKPSPVDIEMGKPWKADWKKDVEKIAQLKSPFIVQMYDAFEDDDYAYIVMEYCETGDLSYMMHQRRTAGQQFTEGVSHSRYLIFRL
jgi:serine/threonine protein kinase